MLEQIQQLAQDAVIEQLGQDAISANYTGPIKDILVKNVTTGGSRAEFIEQAREFMLNTDTGDGRLVNESIKRSGFQKIFNSSVTKALSVPSNIKKVQYSFSPNLIRSQADAALAASFGGAM